MKKTLIIKNFLKKIQSIFMYKVPQPLIKRENIFKNQITAKKEFKLANFGSLNQEKIFYVIKRNPGAGLFSNFVFVMNHIKIAHLNGYIPFVDMQNWTTWYNEIEPVNNTNNSWEYYFKQVSNYKTDEIYNSKYVIITKNDFYEDFSDDLQDDPVFEELLKKYIKIQDHITQEVDYFFSKNLKSKKIFGIYLRGGETKRIPKHVLPPTIKQIDNSIKKILNENKHDFIFLSTKEQEYVNYFKKNYNDKVIFYDSFKENKNDCFKVYPRKNHRYLLGKEILIEMLILSKLDYLAYNTSNVSQMSLFFNHNQNQLRFFFDNGLNHENKYLAQIYWYLKLLIPGFLGGFKKNILRKISK